MEYLSDILAVDPGNKLSAYVRLRHGKVVEHRKIPNEEMLAVIKSRVAPKVLAIEMIASYGMAVGETVFDTVFWIGRFYQASPIQDKVRIYRKDVKMALCNSMKAKDGNIRQALIDVWGGQDVAVGGKKCKKCKGKGWVGVGRPVCPVCNGEKWEHKPGNLYGVSADEWAALGVAYTYEYQKFISRQQYTMRFVK